MRYSADNIESASLHESKYYLSIDKYHRSAAGFFTNTLIYVVPSKSEKALIMTTINPDSWGDLWRIEADHLNKPGAFNSFISILADNNINLLPFESISDQFHVNGGKIFRSSFIVDLAEYSDLTDGDTGRRNHVTKPYLVPFGLKIKLASGSQGLLKPNDMESDWSIKISRMRYFFDYKGIRDDYLEKMWLPGNFFLTASELGRLLPNLDTRGEVSYFLISDTEDKYVKASFLDADSDPAFAIRVRHKEIRGAINEMTDILAHKGANIESSYNRLQEMGNDAYWNALVSVKSEDDLNDIVQQFSTLHNVISVDIKQTHKIDRLRLGIFLSDLPKARLIKKAGPGAPVSRNDIRKSIEELRIDPIHLGKSYKYNARQAFVAMPFERDFETMFEEILTPVVNAIGFHAVKADTPREIRKNEKLMDRITRMIHESALIIADVTNANANVYYELAIAHAIGRNVVFICDFDKTTIEKLPFDIKNYEINEYRFGYRNDLTKKLVGDWNRWV
ncbi:MAG: hypothetical protein WDN24_15620 [Sphingomonas sp.]